MSLCDWLAAGLLAGSNCVSLSLTVVVRRVEQGGKWGGGLLHKASQLEIPESLNGSPNQTTMAGAPCLLGQKGSVAIVQTRYTHTHTHTHT